MGIGQTTVKWLMLLFNLAFWVSGIGLIIAGAVAQTLYRPYLSFLNDGYVSAPVLLICMGAIITIIAFFGCCGSAKENYCMLMTYAVLLGIIFIVELAGGIAGYVERGNVSEYLDENMMDGLHKYNPVDATKDNVVWDEMQADLQCCGVSYYDDWLSADHHNSSTLAGRRIVGKVPVSCCKIRNATLCDRSLLNLQTKCQRTHPEDCPVWTTGCLPLVQKKLEDNLSAIGGVGVGVAFIQLLGIAASCFLAKRIRRGYTYSK